SVNGGLQKKIAINPKVGTFSADNPIAPRMAGAERHYEPELEQGPVHAHRGEAEGPVVGGLPALFLWPQRPVVHPENRRPRQ
ncbi:MAG: hypothetical protein K0M59_09180, partial [Stenotrophomonas sp.]|nr:hypothetical protein [Stenotrophomonas sp.]